MQIANPIYDAVFKFMMEDKRVAKLIIGAITGFEIEDVELRPTEIVTDEDGMRQWTAASTGRLRHLRSYRNL